MAMETGPEQRAELRRYGISTEEAQALNDLTGGGGQPVGRGASAKLVQKLVDEGFAERVVRDGRELIRKTLAGNAVLNALGDASRMDGAKRNGDPERLAEATSRREASREDVRRYRTP